MAYGPVLAYFEQAGRIQVTALVDPVAARTAKLGQIFPNAKVVTRVEDLPPAAGAMAIVASPPGFHAVQSCALLAAGRHVLCEKPLATTVAEAESMIATAQSAQRLLAAGMMRRFYPATQVLRENLKSGLLREPLLVEVVEGGRFGWNAASPNFFDPINGGVLYDLGSHVLDVLCHWFGGPAETHAELDTLGGTNTNALLTAKWDTGLQARIRLSWDIKRLQPGWRIVTTGGECRWQGWSDGPLFFRARGGEWWLQSTVQKTSLPGLAAQSGGLAKYSDQIENMLAAIQGREQLLAPAADVLPSLRWLQHAREHAHAMPQLWLSPAEEARAHQLAQA